MTHKLELFFKVGFGIFPLPRRIPAEISEEIDPHLLKCVGVNFFWADVFSTFMQSENNRDAECVKKMLIERASIRNK